ncbi:MAG: N-6 DNA methylase [Planctomycetes bacterium]|nr:N-6 DNA methylase [Planctomycetota bacterium]
MTTFVDWVAAHIKGDEKGEAQIFLDRLFQAFDQPGCLDVGGAPEFRIKKGAEDGGGTAFADYVWKPVVLIEMKKRGENLGRHFRQAFDYWTRLVPGRPRYVVLCNFDEFWVYDFETQMDTPVDKVSVADLPNRYGPLAFLFRVPEKPVFGNNQEEVTREAADLLAECFNKLIVRRVDRALAQRFILQTLVALFAEDIDLLEKYTLTHLLDECRTPSDSYDLLGGLFEAMNTPGKTAGGRFKGVNYFNGGLFADPARLELHGDELNQLKAAAKKNWSNVRPEIFGTLFQHSTEAQERRAFGAHFTSPVDIMKIVGPTIVAPWRELIENASSMKRLSELHERLERFIVLDPACGSGNFLYIAYREMKRLEARLFERMSEISVKEAAKARRLGFVTASQFYGVDILPFAVELAKVTMMIARKLAIDELHTNEDALPLGNLDANFQATDALINAEGLPAVWPKADVIIGNPPFVGAKLLKPQRGADYVNAVRKAYPDVPGMADYCVYWIRKAHDHLSDCTADDPVAGRAGLVGTQNIRNNQSRVGGLDHVVASGTIVEAVDNQPWSGEANVHVSIANWVKHAPMNPRLTEREQGIVSKQLLIPEKKRLWFKVEPELGKKNIRKKGAGPASKEYELEFREPDYINSALSDETDVSSKRALECNKKPKRCFQGKIPGYEGFMLDTGEARKLRVDSAPVIVPYLTGRELLDEFVIDRWAVDFRNMNMMEASAFPSAFAHCRTHVLQDVQASYKAAQTAKSDMVEARREHLDRWWQFWNRRDQLNNSLSHLRRYIGCSRVTRRPIMEFISTEICPSDLVQVFALDDHYSFGILQSNSHFEWFRKSSRLKVETDTRYSVREVFDTFPWPQAPTVAQIDAVAAAGREVRRIRSEALAKIKGGLRAVYRTLELPGKNSLKDAHAELDKSVLAAYGFSARKDLLAQLLALNLDVARRIDAGEEVTAPGVPKLYPKPARLISDDCIRPD